MLLHAKVLEAKDLPEYENTNIFATLLIDEEGKLNSTEKISSSNPAWNQEFDFQFNNQNSSKLKVKVYNSDGVIDEKIGKAIIPMNSIPNLDQDDDKWYEIKDKQGQVKGSIHLVLNIKDTGGENSDIDIDNLLDQINENDDDEFNAQHTFEAQKYLISFNVISLEGADQLTEMKASDSTPDFYTTLQIKGRKRIVKTCVKVGNMKPTWDQTFNFHTEAKYSTTFIIQLKDHMVKEDKDDIIASCEFPLTEIPDETNDFDSWIEMNSTTDTNEKCRLHVKIHLEPTDDASDDEEDNSNLDIQFDKNDKFPDYCDFDVTIIEAKDLPSVDAFSGADPFCKVQLGLTKETKVIKKTLNPVWNETFHFSIGNRSDNYLIITVIDDNKITKDEKISKIEIPASSFDEITDKWYDLQPFKNAKKGGKIHILVKCMTPYAYSKSFSEPQQHTTTHSTSTVTTTTTTTTTQKNVTISSPQNTTTITHTTIVTPQSTSTSTVKNVNMTSQSEEIENHESTLQNEGDIVFNPPWIMTEEEQEALNQEGKPVPETTQEQQQEGEIGFNPPWMVDQEAQLEAGNTEEQSKAENTEEQPGAENTEEQPAAEEIGTNPPWMVDQEEQPETENTEEQPGAINTEEQPGAINTEEQPGTENQEEQPATEEIGTNPPWIVDLDSQNEPLQNKSLETNLPESQETGNQEGKPGAGNQEEQTGAEEIGTNPPWMVDQEEQPGTENQEEQPGTENQEEQPATEEIGTNPPWMVDLDSQNKPLQNKSLDTKPLKPQETENSEEQTATEEIGTNPPWMVDQEEQPETENTEEQPGEEKAEEQPGAINAGEQPATEEIGTNPPWMVDQEEQSRTENTEEQPGTENTEEQPGTENTEEQPGEENTEKQTGAINTEEQPATEEIGTNPPWMVDQEEQPGTENKEEQPGEEVGVNPPWIADQEEQQETAGQEEGQIGNEFEQDNNEIPQQPDQNEEYAYDEGNQQFYDDGNEELDEDQRYKTSPSSSQRNKPRSPRERLDETMTAYIKFNMEVDQKQSPTKSQEPQPNEEEQVNEEEEFEKEFQQELEERKQDIKEQVVADALKIYQEKVLNPLQRYNPKKPTMKSTDRVLFNNENNLNSLRDRQCDPENMSPNKLKREIRNLEAELENLDQEIQQLEIEIEELQQ